MDGVVAVAPLKVVVAAQVRHDVVARTAEDHVDAVAAIEPVIAGVAVERVVADAGNDRVIAGGAAEDDVILAGVLEVVRIRRLRSGIVPNHQPDGIIRCQEVVGALIFWCRGIVKQDAVRTGDHTLVVLPRLVDLEDEAGCREDVAREMRRVGVGHDQLRERVVLQLAEEVEPLGAFQVVEPVAVLQLLHLFFEDEVEGRAEHAAERHLLLGEAADPQIDGVDAGRGHAVRQVSMGAGAVQEVETVGRRPIAAQDEKGGRRALVCSVVALVMVSWVP